MSLAPKRFHQYTNKYKGPYTVENLNKDIFVRFKFLIMIHTSPITDFKIIIGGRVLVCYYFFSWGGAGGVKIGKERGEG